MDASGAPALEATLRTTALNGAPDTPVTNVRMIVRNRSTLAYAFVSGSVTFYDAAGVRCGEGVFKADALAVDESFETDSPGLRIRCEASHLAHRGDEPAAAHTAQRTDHRTDQSTAESDHQHRWRNAPHSIGSAAHAHAR